MKKLAFILLVLGSAASAQPIDPNATPETVNLFYNLRNLSKGSLLFGHEDALAYGLNQDGSRWIDEDNRSDVKSVTGSHPAVYGWEIGRLELEDSAANIDDVNFERMRYWIRTGYERGGIITISWHSNNPQTGGTTWDTGGNAPSHVIPGGDKHDMYKTWLDRVADFANSLKDSQGKYIPVLFRPYHEHMGSWFWWGRNSCTVEEYITLWRFTVEYLRDVKGIHHFLYAYSPNDVSSENSYLERYPGDEYVDILGTDDYSNIYNIGGQPAFLNNLRIAATLANEKGKVAALTETGYEKIPDADWFTTRIVEPIKQDSIARQIAYFLVWRNGRPDHYYAPYPGHQAADDLIEIYQDHFVLFEDELQDLYIVPEVTILQQLPDLEFEADVEMEYSLDLMEYFDGAVEFEIAHADNEEIVSLSLEGSNLLISPQGISGNGEYRIRGSSSNQYMELMFLVTANVAEEEMVLGYQNVESIVVYPNPTSDYLNLTGHEYRAYSIYTAEGKLVDSSDIENQQIDVRNISSGVYNLVLKKQKQVIFKRFIKQ